jgi:2-polyprenyl-3-methyl-5-hydroxy-6-metoxy-1,4-benzoquinol methylase
MPVGFQQRESCPLCESNSSRLLVEIPYSDQRLVEFIERFYRGRVAYKSLRSESYRVVLCQQCDFIYQDSILDEKGMQTLYEDWIDHQQSLLKKQTAGTKLYRQYADQIQTLARLLKPRPDQVRILDYGMGWGYWSRMAQAHGFDVAGFELSKQRREYARNMGITVIDTLPAGLAGFDCVYANQVFEHLPDPKQALADICRQLKPQGIVCIRVPDGRGVAASLEQRGWSPELGAIHPLEHINCFTRKTLLSFAAKAGLKPFNPPLRLSWDSLWSGIRREVADRLLTTHLFLKRQQ